MNVSKEVQVNFEVSCDDFAVPDWPELRCSATYNVHGYVEVDDSGPVPTSRPSVMLLDAKAYTISIPCDLEGWHTLPDWLQYRLVTEDGDKFYEAFLAAIGGQGKLDELAVEQALGL